MGILSHAKDRLIEQAALAYLNGTFLETYGRATSLRINSKDKTILIEAELKGETTPLQIEVDGYKINHEGHKYFVTFKSLRTSREWLTALAENELQHRRFALPASTARLLMKVL